MSGVAPGLPATHAGGASIGWLADHPQWAEVLAPLHHAEWSGLLSGWTLDDALAELRDHANRRALPTTWVAHAEGRPVGSISLVATDAPEFAEWGPWLASFWVHPDWRRRGIGQALVDRLLWAARRWGHDAVYLFTAGATRQYERNGFRTIEQRALAGQAVCIMRRELRPIAAGS